MQPPVTTHEIISRELGINLVGSGGNLACRCPFPEHDDRNASFSVNANTGQYKCHGCGKSGNTITFLVERMGYSKKEAYELANGPDDARSKPPPQDLPKLLKRLPVDAVARHEYKWSNGNIAFLVLRFDKAKSPKRPKCLPYTPSDGGWRSMLRISKRPLYRLPELLGADRQRQVWIPEGEKCVDTLIRHFPKAVATTWAGGASPAGSNARKWRLTDLRPLKGRKVLLMADADEAGRDEMRALADELWRVGAAEVKVALPPGDSKEDVHDWLEAGGPRAMNERLKDIVREHPKPNAREERRGDGKKERKEREAPNIDAGVIDDAKFRVMGFAGTSVAILKSTHDIRTFSVAALCDVKTLIELAPIQWWLRVTGQPALSGAIAMAVGDMLIRRAEKAGHVDLTKIVGRGLFRDERGNWIWNLGNRLLTDGKEVPLSACESLVAVSGAPIPMAAAPATAEERKEAADALLSYRWSTQRDGKVFAGWMVTACIGGALDWRPHAWIVATAQSGKSWILRAVAEAFMREFVVRTADTTQAGLAVMMQSDALGVIVDEAEPDKPWVLSLLDVVRVSAGGDGLRLRADRRGPGVIAMAPRMSAMFSSTKLPKLDAADMSRFAMIELGRTVDDWPRVKKAIEKAFSPERCARYRAALVRDAPGIVKRAAELVELYTSSGMQTRTASVYGALGAAWEWWAGKGSVPMPRDGKPGSGGSDAWHLLMDILALPLRSKGEEVTIAMALSNPSGRAGQLADRGVRIWNGGLAIAPQHPALQRAMARTRWESVDLKSMLCQVPGAAWHDNALAFAGIRKRCVVLDREACEKNHILVGQPDMKDLAPLEGDEDEQDQAAVEPAF